MKKYFVSFTYEHEVPAANVRDNKIKKQSWDIIEIDINAFDKSPLEANPNALKTIVSALLFSKGYNNTVILAMNPL